MSVVKSAGAKRRKGSRILGNLVFALVILIGSGMIGYPLLANWLYLRTVEESTASYTRSVSGLNDKELKAMWDEAYAYNHELGNPRVRDPFSEVEITSPLDRYNKVLNPDGSGMMGYVEVPRAGIDLPIYHGTSERVLQIGAGHIATTALPIDGTSIHPILTGHTALPDRMLFTNLTRVRKGDYFSMRILDKTFWYRVASIDVILPSDTSKLQPKQGDNRLTLLTCTPYGINSHRLLVTGVPSDPPPEDEGPSYPPLWWAWVCFAAFLLLVLAEALIGRARRWYRRRLRMVRAGNVDVSGPFPSSEFSEE